jgi:hypothetical protein
VPRSLSSSTPLSLFNNAVQGYRRVLHLLRFPPSNYGLQSTVVILAHVSPSKFPFLLQNFRFSLSPFFFMSWRRRPLMASLPAVAPFRFPSLSLCPYLRSSPSSCPPSCTHIMPSRTRAPHTPSVATPISAAVGRARRRSRVPFFFFLSDDASVARGVLSCRRFTSSTSPGAPTPSAVAPPRARRRR